MIYKKFTVYDNDEFFEKYSKKRNKGDAPNELIEQPIFDELMGNVHEKQILDLGCGDGKYGVVLLKRGAKQYHGIEGAQNMARLAQQHLTASNSTVEVGDIEDVALKKLGYDLIISRLVLHYIEDVEKLLKRIGESLREEGVFIFSIEHPIITSCNEAYQQTTRRGNWIVDNYFDSGERVNEWIGEKVVKYHRTLEDYWQIIQRTNFEVLAIREAKPVRENFEKQEEYDRRKRIPLFLFFKVKKK